MQGPQGLTGDTGPAGSPGGLSDVEIIFVGNPAWDEDMKSALAECPVGKVVISGGYNLAVTDQTEAHAIAMIDDRPANELDVGIQNPANPQGWFVQGLLTDNGPLDTPFEITAWAICATPN